MAAWQHGSMAVWQQLWRVGMRRFWAIPILSLNGFFSDIALLEWTIISEMRMQVSALYLADLGTKLALFRTGTGKKKMWIVWIMLKRDLDQGFTRLFLISKCPPRDFDPEYLTEYINNE
jgi:hypothetical protein